MSKLIMIMMAAGLMTGLLGCRSNSVSTSAGTEDGPSRYQLEREIEQLKQKLEESETKYKVSESRMASVEERNVKLEDKLRELRLDIDQQTEIISHLKSLPDYREQARVAQLEVIRLKGELQRITTELDLLKQKTTVLTEPETKPADAPKPAETPKPTLVD